MRLVNVIDPAAQIDSVATDGLTGVVDSLAYRVHEIAEHLNARSRWLGRADDQTAGSWSSDQLTPYRAISGANEYGTDPGDEAKIIGVDNGPYILGNVSFDLHQLLIVDVSEDTEYKLRIVYSDSTLIAGLVADQYTEAMIKFDRLNPQQSAGIPFDVRMPRVDVGTQVWAQAWNVTDDATIDFYVAIHEYEG